LNGNLLQAFRSLDEKGRGAGVPLGLFLRPFVRRKEKKKTWLLYLIVSLSLLFFILPVRKRKRGKMGMAVSL